MLRNLPTCNADGLWRAPGETSFDRIALQMGRERTLEVREYGLGCFGALVEIYTGLQPKPAAQGLLPLDGARIADWVGKLPQKSRSLVAMDGNRVVAQAILCPTSEAAAEYAIFVHQDVRWEELGKALTRLAVAFAGEMGFRKVLLTTELSNFAALCLFRNVAFQVSSSYGGECEMKLSVTVVLGVQPEAA